MSSIPMSIIVLATMTSGGPTLHGASQMTGASVPVGLIQSVAGAKTSDIYFVAQLRVTQPRIVLGPSNSAIGFLTIENRGNSYDRLTGAAFDATDQATLTSAAPGAAAAKGLDIGPGEKVDLSPGTYEVALNGLRKPVKSGEALHGVLRFERAGPLDVDFVVEPGTTDSAKDSAAIQKP